MDIKKKIEIEFDKILEKNPELNFQEEAKSSSILLFRDYFKRLSIWKKALNSEFKYLKNHAPHNLFLDLNPDWKNEIPTQKEFLETIKLLGINTYYLSGNSFNGLFIYLFICWELFKDKEEIKKFPSLPNPYESAIKVAERNNYIRRVESRFYINDLVFIDRSSYLDFTLPSINNDFLDFIDIKYPIEQKRITTIIPTQEETNQLWEEFKQIK